MDKCALLNALRAEDFVLYETALYLDTHPNDGAAMEYYKNHSMAASKLRSEYESLYGPLTLKYQFDASSSWSWINSPWPWEKEAN